MCPLITRRSRVQNLFKYLIINTPPSELSMHPNNVSLRQRDYTSDLLIKSLLMALRRK